MHAASRRGIPTLTSPLKDNEVSCDIRPPRSPIQSLTSLDQAKLQSPDKDCISHLATHPIVEVSKVSFQSLLQADVTKVYNENNSTIKIL